MEQDRAESIGTQNAAKAITAQDYQVLRLMREMDYGHIVITVKGPSMPRCRKASKSSDAQLKFRKVLRL